MPYLVLTRSIGQKIRIRDDVEITVTAIRNNRVVGLGIKAPKNVAVHRGEIYEQIKQKQTLILTKEKGT